MNFNFNNFQQKREPKKLSFKFEKGSTKQIIISIIATLVFGFLYFYISLPAINIFSKDLYKMVAVLAVFYLVVFALLKKFSKSEVKVEGKIAINFIPLIVLGVIVVILILGSLFSSPFFNAKKYASVIDVQEANFAEDMPKTTNVTNIALMDTASATVLGNRTLGSLSEMVSQYELSDTYTQINYQKTPQKVATLEYAGFFKWLGNKANGIPGFVMVDPVKNEAKYVSFKNSIKYTRSGYFGDDLMRKLRFSYPTKIFDSEHIYFEVNDEGEPFYIVPCYMPKVGIFGAMDISEVILFDPTTGEGTLYSVDEVPSWVDIVYDGYLACEKYDWQGLYSGGYWNSVIGNVGCKETTDDFGYIVIGDDVWYFTGVTSVNSDKSNIGFIISNARTGEYKFYPIIGAEEYSAMSASEGEVQEKGYQASFPSLVNIEGNATYIMVLKDDAGLVKLYSLVNVENYGIVATGQTQTDAISAYIKLLQQNGLVKKEEPSEPIEEEYIEISVEDIRLVNTSMYLYFGDKVYKGDVVENEALMLIKVGDKVEIMVEKTEIDRLYNIVKIK